MHTTPAPALSRRDATDVDSAVCPHRVGLAAEAAEAVVEQGGRTRMVSGSLKDGEAMSKGAPL